MTNALAASLSESEESEARYARVWVRWASSTIACVRLGTGLTWARNGVDGVTAQYAQLVTVEDRDGVLTVASIDNATATDEPFRVYDGLPYDGDLWHASEDPEYAPSEGDQWHPAAAPLWTMQRTGTQVGEAASLLTELEYGWVRTGGVWRARSGWAWYGRQVRRWPRLGWLLLKATTPDPLPVRISLATGYGPPAPGESPFVPSLTPREFDVTLTYRERPYRLMLPFSWYAQLASGSGVTGIYVGPATGDSPRLSRLAVGVGGGLSMHTGRPSDLTEAGTPAWSSAGEVRDY